MNIYEHSCNILSCVYSQNVLNYQRCWVFIVSSRYFKAFLLQHITLSIIRVLSALQHHTQEDNRWLSLASVLAKHSFSPTSAMVSLHPPKTSLMHLLQNGSNKENKHNWVVTTVQKSEIFFLCFLQEKEEFILSQLRSKGLTVRDENGEDTQHLCMLHSVCVLGLSCSANTFLCMKIRLDSGIVVKSLLFPAFVNVFSLWANVCVRVG